MIRPPWSRRQSDDEIAGFFLLREGVPDGFLPSLTDLVLGMFYIQDEDLGHVYCNRELINQLARHTDRHLPPYRMDASEQLEQDREFLLDAVDFTLGVLSPDSYEATKIVAKLNEHLAEARSAYVVGLDGNGRYELQYRQPEELTALVAEATSGTDRAREHLRRAWSKAFGRTADPNGACVDAVAAIEVAARPIVSPNNAKSTLGTLIRDMKAKPTKWTTSADADDDIGKVIAMMDMAWTGHFRHGDDSKPIDVSNGGAQMIVQLAALLVHWFASGRIVAVES